MIVKEAPKLKNGRPQNLSAGDKREIARFMVNGSAKTAVGASKLVNSEREDQVSAQTVRRALREQGLKAIKKKKPKLSKAHQRARLNWALCHENWTKAD